MNKSFQIDPDDDDFAELDEYLAQETKADRELKALKGAQARLNRMANKPGAEAEAERIALLAEIRKYEDAYIWRSVKNVAIIYIQHCTACGTSHKFFEGWFTFQQHRTDPFCNRKIKGHSVEWLPEEVDEHNHGEVTICGSCADSQILINNIAKSNG